MKVIQFLFTLFALCAALSAVDARRAASKRGSGSGSGGAAAAAARVEAAQCFLAQGYAVGEAHDYALQADGSWEQRAVSVLNKHEFNTEVRRKKRVGVNIIFSSSVFFFFVLLFCTDLL